MNIERAFVLHAIDYRDSSKILYLYTPAGHQNVIAHGVKKLNSINRYLSQVGTMIKCTTSDGKLPSLRDGELRREYEHVKSDLVAFTYLSHILELVRNTISEDADHEKMFAFLGKLFDRMDDGQDPELLTFIFELKLLYFLGTGLHLHACTTCGEQTDLVFHVSSGGLICRDHVEPGMTIYERPIYGQLMVLYYIDLDRTELPRISADDRIVIRAIIDMLYDEFVGYHTKSRGILRQIKKY